MSAPRVLWSLVIAGRLVLLGLAAFATVWALVLAGGREHAASGSGEHGHGAHVGGARQDDQAASGGEPATRPAGSEPIPAPDDKTIGTAERRVFALAVRAPAWLETPGRVIAVLHQEELTGLSPGEHALFFRATAWTKGIDVQLTAEPPGAWNGSTLRVHFRIDPRAAGLEPGAVGWVKLAARSRELLVVPSSAVLYSPQGPYVLAAGVDGRTFAARRVEIGTVSRGQAVVLSGLQDREPIVVGSAFSWGAEQRRQFRRAQPAGVTP